MTSSGKKLDSVKVFCDALPSEEKKKIKNRVGLNNV